MICASRAADSFLALRELGSDFFNSLSHNPKSSHWRQGFVHDIDPNGWIG